jgi:hypothetical protein
MVLTIEIISDHGKKLIYSSLSSVLEVITNPDLVKKVIVVIIIKDGISKVWFYKSLANEWYLESEEKLCEISDEYKNIYNSRLTDKNVWVCRELPGNELADIDFKLHITRDLDIHQYRVKFESLSIQSVSSNEDFLEMLSRYF